MKRFIDTEILVRPWFRKLEPRLKLLWLWMMTQCDMAGVLDMDWELASFAIGVKVKESDLEAMNDNAKVLRGSKIWLPRFVEFQYGVLGEESRVHKGVLKTLESHGIGYHKGMLTPKDKDKDKDKDGLVGGCKGEGAKPPDEPIKAPPKQSTAIPECLAAVEGFAEAFAAWVEFRAAKRAKATDRVKATILKRLSERPEQAVAALDTCMAAGWTDVRWDWIDNRNRATSHTGDPRNAKPGGFYDSGSQEDAWPELTAAERRAAELEGRAK